MSNLEGENIEKEITHSADPAIERTLVLEKTEDIFRQARELADALNQGKEELAEMLERFKSSVGENEAVAREKIATNDTGAAMEAVATIRQEAIDMGVRLNSMETQILDFLRTIHSNKQAMGYKE